MFQPYRLIVAASILGVAACPQSTATPLAKDSWTLDGDASELSFVTVKAGDIGEAHSFSGLKGVVTPEGVATLTIDLATVDTGIEIRDQRVRDVLFEVSTHPLANVTAHIDPANLVGLKVGKSLTMPVAGKLGMRGFRSQVEAQLEVTRIGPDTVMVTTTRPIIVDAGTFGMGEGLETLRAMAHLPAISTTVPVTFSLTYKR